ncbi:MAG: hypothetical protein AAF715_15210 [Myxococcota bacterium]
MTERPESHDLWLMQRYDGEVPWREGEADAAPSPSGEAMSASDRAKHETMALVGDLVRAHVARDTRGAGLADAVLGRLEAERAQAPAAPPGLDGAGLAPAGLAPAGLAPAGLAPAGLAPAGLAPAGLAPAGLAPVGLAPAGLDGVGLDAVGLVGEGARRKEGEPGSPAPAAAVGNDNGRFLYGMAALAGLAAAAAVALFVWAPSASDDAGARASAPSSAPSSMGAPGARARDGAAMPAAAAPGASEAKMPALTAARDDDADDDDAVPAVEVASVDFGRHQGSVFYVAGRQAGATAVVWVNDEEER